MEIRHFHVILNFCELKKLKYMGIFVHILTKEHTSFNGNMAHLQKCTIRCWTILVNITFKGAPFKK